MSQAPGSKITVLDVYAKVAIGVIGLIVAGALGFGQLSIARSQRELLEQQMGLQRQLADRDALMRAQGQKLQAELQVLGIVKDLIPLVNEPGRKGSSARRVLGEAASYLSENFDNRILAMVARSALQDDVAATNDRAVIRIAEATEPVPPNSQSFAVLASFDLSPAGKKRALREAADLGGRIQADGSDLTVAVFQTKASKQYAVTLGGRQGKERAAELVALARARGWAADAYPQLDRDWAIVPPEADGMNKVQQSP